jgi:hypothetical protein
VPALISAAGADGMPLVSDIHGRAASQSGEQFLTAACASTIRIRPRRSRAPFEALVKTRPRPSNERYYGPHRGCSRARQRSGVEGSVVAMATPVDPILTAIERDRIAYVAFTASLNKTDGRKAAQEKGCEVAHTDENAHEAARAGWGDAVGESRDDGVWRQS